MKKYKDVEEHIPTPGERERARKAIEEFYQSFRDDLTKKRPLTTDQCCIHCRLNEPMV